MKHLVYLLKTLLFSLVLTSAIHAKALPQAYSHEIAEVLSESLIKENKNLVKTKAKLYVWQSYQSANKWNVDPLLLLAMMKVESNYREKVVNSYGAVGLLQIVPRWHPEKVKGKNLKDYKDNIDVSARILDEYLKLNQENLQKAIYRYSGGSKTYYQKVKKQYQVLRARLFEYKLSHHRPISAAYVLDKPRVFVSSQAAEQITDESQAFFDALWLKSKNI